MRSNVISKELSPLKKFCESIPDLLKKSGKEEVPGSIVSIVVPDRFLDSEETLAATIYNALEGRSFDTVIFVSPSHASTFQRIGVSNASSIHSLAGNYAVNTNICHELCDEDDDIYLEDTRLYHDLSENIQLSFLSEVLGEFDIVPVVMGVDAPDYCFELGQAVGEIMFNHRALLVATADFQDIANGQQIAVKSALESGNMEALMSLLNSSPNPMNGKGPLLVALIAAMHRRANGFQMIEHTGKEGLKKGFSGAIFYKV